MFYLFLCVFSIFLPSFSGIYAFVTLKEHDIDEVVDDIKKDLAQVVRQQIAAYAVPDVIQVKLLSVYQSLAPAVIVTVTMAQRHGVLQIKLLLILFKSDLLRPQRRWKMDWSPSPQAIQQHHARP